MKGTRLHFSAFVQLITGFNFLKLHQSRVDGYNTEDDDEEELEILRQCGFCKKAEESSFHIFAECEAFGKHRWQIFGQVTLKAPFKIRCNDLKVFLSHPRLTAFVDYFQD